jgi:hypothetical protein
MNNTNTLTTDNATTYAVVVVFSKWPLRQLCAFLEDELGASQDQIGLMRIDRSKGQETNRTIMLVKRELLTTAEKKGFTEHKKGVDFQMSEYGVREFNKPQKGYTRNFFIPLPEKVTFTDATAQLENKLDIFCKFGMFEKNKPRLNIPLASRETEKHSGHAFVTFSRETKNDEIVLARILLNDTRIYTNETEYELMKCLWARDRTHPSTPKDSSGKTGAKKSYNRTGTKTNRKKAPGKKFMPRDNKVPSNLETNLKKCNQPQETTSTQEVETSLDTTVETSTDTSVPTSLDFPSLK